MAGRIIFDSVYYNPDKGEYRVVYRVPGYALTFVVIKLGVGYDTLKLWTKSELAKVSSHWSTKRVDPTTDASLEAIAEADALATRMLTILGGAR